MTWANNTTRITVDPTGRYLPRLTDAIDATGGTLAGIRDNPAGIRTTMIPANGVQLHAGLEGDGDLVILIHGFPANWYIWRHQIPFLAAAGYRVCAPDQRGYGLSECPPGIEDYDILKVSADIVGLADHLEAETFTVVGQDWGCITAWHVALLYPHRVRGVFGFSAPYVPGILRNWVEPEAYRDQFWYTRYFMHPGVAERELEPNLRRYLMWMWHAACAGSETDVMSIIAGGPKDRLLLDGLGETPQTVGGHTEADLEYSLWLYEQSGIRGSLNYYRNMARMRDITPWLEQARILVPAMFGYGGDEPVAKRALASGQGAPRTPLDMQDDYFADLLGKVCIDDAGHWPMVEQPDAVNQHILEFLMKVSPVT